MPSDITSELAWNDYEARCWLEAVRTRELLMRNLDPSMYEVVKSLRFAGTLAEHKCNPIR